MLAGYSRTAAGGGGNASRANDGRIAQALDAHERFVRGEPGGMRAIIRSLQLPASDFTGRLLSDADFTGCNLAGAKLTAIIAERICFYCADLRGVSLRDAVLNGADLRGVSLKSADLSGAQMDGVDLREAILAKDELTGLHLTGRGGAAQDGAMTVAVDFSDASMKGARLGGVRLKNANFRGAMLQGADFKGARLEGADFDGAVLTGVALDQMGLPMSAFRNCVTDPDKFAYDQLPSIRTSLEMSERWAMSNGKLGTPAKLDRTDLRILGGALAGAKLTAASMVGVQAFGVDFSNAQLQGANMTNADLRDADFTGADLRGARLTGARLRGAIFRGADMRPLALASGASRPVDLTDANYSPMAMADAIRG